MAEGRSAPGGAAGADPAWRPPEALSRVAELDHDRLGRRGYAEAVLCEPKSVDHLVTIAGQVRSSGTPTLFTRVRDDQVGPLLDALPGARHEPEARLVVVPAEPPEPTGGLVVVVAAGTSDLPVALEALHTARHLGRACELVVDVGVAGLHRVLGHLDLLRRARVLVVVAGMDGALPGVVAGLVAAPVVAVPTSVGYGASFSGLAPLLTMLTACAPGVSVVGIDNGYGAGHVAAQVAAS